MDPSLETLLRSCMSNDNAERSKAEEALKSLSAKTAVISQLVQLLQQTADMEVKLLASVLLRKRVPRHWAQIDAVVRQQVQSVLLELLTRESFHSVVRGVADCVSCVARLTAPKGEWPQLLHFLEQCSQSTESNHREVALTLFGSLAESIGDFLMPALMGMIAVVQVALVDPSISVRRAALSAMEPLALLITEQQQIAGYHGLVAAMLQTAKDAVTHDVEDIVVLCAQIILTLCEIPAPLLQPHLPSLVVFAVETACNVKLELETREQALQVLNWIARYKPKQLTRNKVVIKQVVTSLCALCSEPQPPNVEDDPGELTAHKMAAQALDTLACNCASQHVYPQIITYAKPAAVSANPSERLAAMTVLAVASEGCAESMRKQLKLVLPMVLQGLQDPEQSVRGAAAFAMGQFSEFLQPDIVEHYQTVLPAVFTLMHDNTPGVQERACYALDAFVENLEEEILPYMPQIVEKLVEVLRTGSHTMQDVALSAIASTVAAAGKDFEPYVGTLLPILQHFMSTTSPELLSHRCHSTECAGLLIESLPEHPAVAPLIPAFMQLGLASFQPQATPSPAAAAAGPGSSEIREYSHGLFARVAKALQAGFAPYLPYVVPAALEAMGQEDVTFPSDGESQAEADGGADVSLTDDDEEEDDGGKMCVRTGVMDEKCAASMALGHYAQAVPAAFAPYLETALPALTNMMAYFHEDVRAEACQSLGRISAAVHVAYPPPSPSALSNETSTVLATTLPLMVDMLEDEDKHVVTAAILAVSSLLTDIGPQAVGASLLKVSETASQVLKGQAPCQEDPEDDEEGEDEDEVSGEREEELLTAVAELLPVMAKAGGAEAYAPIFAAAHLGPLLSRMKPLQPDGIRAAMTGSIAELAEVMQGHMSAHLERLVPVLSRELRADDSTNRQNAAFCVGTLFLGCGAASMAPYQPQLLQALFPLFQEDEASGAQDNAASAVARIMLSALNASMGAALPVEQILPVFLRALPLKEDIQEATVVYTALAKLLQSGDMAQRISSLLPSIMQAYGAAAVQSGIPAEATQAIGFSVASLVAQFPAEMHPLIAALPADQQQALSALAAQATPAAAA